MVEVAQQLNQIIEDAHTRLMTITEANASSKPYDEKWSYKEILGHLIDSASNNHQRFVRMQETNAIGAFRYNQEHWVHSQNYLAEPWEALVNLWYYYNKHLVHVIANIDPHTLNSTCDMGYPKSATLKFVVEDYVRHVQHHINQIFGNYNPRQRPQWVRSQ